MALSDRIRDLFLRTKKTPSLKTSVIQHDRLDDGVLDDMQVKDAIEAGGFVIGAIVDYEIGELVEATANIMRAIDKQREQNMAVLFYWNLAHMDLMSDDGVILPNPTAPNYPAPLTGDEARRVMELMALSPKAKPNVRVETHCEDGTKLQLWHGKVTTL